jgi:hypothetical protein
MRWKIQNSLKLGLVGRRANVPIPRIWDLGGTLWAEPEKSWDPSVLSVMDGEFLGCIWSEIEITMSVSCNSFGLDPGIEQNVVIGKAERSTLPTSTQPYTTGLSIAPITTPFLNSTLGFVPS